MNVEWGDFCVGFFSFFTGCSSLLAYFLHFLSPNHSICASSRGMAGELGNSFLISSSIPANDPRMCSWGHQRF